MITRLHLTNWRKHRNLDLTFTEGLNLLVGQNWAGKSSALSAIPFALFGTRATPGTAADLTMFGETDMQVELEFEAGGETYLVTRSLKSASLTCQGAKKATGNSPVTAEIERLIGVSRQDFLDFNLTRQGEADALLSAGPTKLSDYVARVTGTDVIDAAQERIKSEVQLCRGALLGLPELTVSAVADLTAELAQTQEALQRLKAAADAAEAASELATGENIAASTSAKTLRDQVIAATEAKKQHEFATWELERAEERFLNALAALGEAPSVDADALRARQAELRDLEASLALRQDQDRRRAELDHKLAAAKLQVAAQTEALAGTELVDETAAQAEHETLLEACRQAELAASQASKAAESAMCPYCMRPFDDLDPTHLAKDLEEAEAALRLAQEAADATWEALGVLRGRNAVVMTRKAHLSSWVAHLEALTAEEEALKQEVVLVDLQELEILRAACAWDAKKLTAYQACEHERDLASRQVDQAKEALNALPVPAGPSEEEVVAAEAEARKASERAWEARNALTQATTTLREQESSVRTLEGSLKQADSLITRRTHFVTRESGFQELGKFLRTNRDRFTAAFWDQLLGYASNMIQEATSGAVTKLSRNASGDFVYTEAGREIAVEGSASGMQRAIFSTAIKLSLAAAVGSPFPVMLFDEVTAAAQDEVSLQFTALLASAGKQVILVTHRSADAAAADHVIELTG